MGSHGAHVVEREAESRGRLRIVKRGGRGLAHKGFPDCLAPGSGLGSDGMVELIMHSAPTILYLAVPHQRDNV